MLVQQHKAVNVTEIVLWAIVIVAFLSFIVYGIATNDWGTGAPNFTPAVDPFPGW